MRLGPITAVTIIVNELGSALAFYQGRLGLILTARGALTQPRALAMGEAGLIAAAYADLTHAEGTVPWLRLIEGSDAKAPVAGRGWIGMHLRLPTLSDADELIGPGGERLRAAHNLVPGPVARLILGCTNPASARSFYAGLGLLDGMDALAIGALQGGQQIDFINAKSAAAPQVLRTGIRLVSFARSDAHGQRLHGADDPSARILGGAEGEGVELV